MQKEIILLIGGTLLIFVAGGVYYFNKKSIYTDAEINNFQFNIEKLDSNDDERISMEIDTTTNEVQVLRKQIDALKQQFQRRDDDNKPPPGLLNSINRQNAALVNELRQIEQKQRQIFEIEFHKRLRHVEMNYTINRNNELREIQRAAQLFQSQMVSKSELETAKTNANRRMSELYSKKELEIKNLRDEIRRENTARDTTVFSELTKQKAATQELVAQNLRLKQQLQDELKKSTFVRQNYKSPQGSFQQSGGGLVSNKQFNNVPSIVPDDIEFQKVEAHNNFNSLNKSDDSHVKVYQPRDKVIVGKNPLPSRPLLIMPAENRKQFDVPKGKIIKRPPSQLNSLAEQKTIPVKPNESFESFGLKRKTKSKTEIQKTQLAPPKKPTTYLSADALKQFNTENPPKKDALQRNDDLNQQNQFRDAVKMPEIRTRGWQESFAQKDNPFQNKRIGKKRSAATRTEKDVLKTMQDDADSDRFSDAMTRDSENLTTIKKSLLGKDVVIPVAEKHNLKYKLRLSNFKKPDF